MESFSDIARNIKASVVEIFSRKMKYNTSDLYYENGDDNFYPLRMERVMTNSPTGSRGLKLLVKFIFGQGLDIQGDKIVTNEDSMESLNEFVYKLCWDLGLQGGFYILVKYQFDIETGSITVDKNRLRVMDYLNCRIGKPDDDDNPSKIVIGDFDDRDKGRKFKKKDLKYYPPFNPKERVVKSQIIEQYKAKHPKENITEGSPELLLKMVNSFSGQILYVNTTPQYTYALSRFNAVYDDCDTEYRISLYTNTQSRTGFLGKLAIITNGIDPETSATIEQDIQKWLGAENASNIYLLDLDGHENPESALITKELKGNWDDKMYIETDKRLVRNILGACNNLPEGLVFSNDGSLFDNSGEKYVQMKIFYNEQTEHERDIINATLRRLGLPYTIKPFEFQEPITEQPNIQTDANNIR